MFALLSEYVVVAGKPSSQSLRGTPIGKENLLPQFVEGLELSGEPRSDFGARAGGDYEMPGFNAPILVASPTELG